MEFRIAIVGLLLSSSAHAAGGPAILWAADSGVPRADHGAALLPDGRVLVEGRPRSAQLYDPATNSWSDAGFSLDTHSIYSLVRLRDGTVMIVDNGPTYEWWSPASPVWTAAPSGARRQQGVAMLLSSGRMLTGCGDDGSSYVDPFEWFDQDAGVWRAAGAQIAPTSRCALSPLPGDRWLKTGGYDSASSVAELWSMDGGQASALRFDRSDHTSTVLPDGRVLITGGTSVPVPVEIFDPSTDTWDSGTVPAEARYVASATVLPDGRVLVAGGENGSTTFDTAEMWDPVNGWADPPLQLGTPRAAHLAVMLPNGRVLLTGGYDGTRELESSELIDFSSPFVSEVPAPPKPMATPRFGTARGALILWDDHGAVAYRLDPQGTWIALPPPPSNPGAAAVTLADGRLLRVGASVDGYDPARDAWFTLPGLDAGHPRAAAALLGTGEVLIAGGEGPTARVVLLDPRTATWSTTDDLPSPTRDAQATTLPGGDVLLCGGETPGGVTEWCWVYTASTRQWTSGARSVAARRRFSLTTLESGRVLLAGGENDAGVVSDAEIFEPSSATWTPAAPLAEARSGHAALRLRNGQVLVIGGTGGGGALATTERFDPVTSAFTPGPALGGPRAAPAAAMTADGQVLIAGAEDARLERFDEGRGARPEWAPVLGAPPRALPGAVVTVSGVRLTGVTPGSSGNLRDSPGNLPVLALVGADGRLLRPGAIEWTPSSVTFQVPRAASTGWFTLSASVNGIEGAAQPFALGLDQGQRCDAGAECAAGACSGGLCVAPPQTEVVVVPDAGPPPDAGPGPDAGPTADAGSGPPLSVGCGCASASAGAWALLLLLLVALGQRRSRPKAMFRP